MCISTSSQAIKMHDCSLVCLAGIFLIHTAVCMNIPASDRNEKSCRGCRFSTVRWLNSGQRFTRYFHSCNICRCDAQGLAEERGEEGGGGRFGVAHSWRRGERGRGGGGKGDVEVWSVGLGGVVSFEIQ